MGVQFWNDFKPLSSHVDWCENNYAFFPLIAEFWNTEIWEVEDQPYSDFSEWFYLVVAFSGIRLPYFVVKVYAGKILTSSNCCFKVSNAIFFIIPPILMYLFQQYARQVCSSVYLVWSLLIIVGAGSVFFHSTLSLVGQLIDEIAILWVCMAALAAWLPTKYLPKCLSDDRRKFQAVILVSSVATTFFSLIKPEFNHVFLFLFGIPACILLAKELQICKCPRVFKVGVTAAVWWTIAMLCWLSDRFMCGVWVEIFNFPYLHSAWHILVCLASYMACVCYAYFYASHEVPEQCPTLRFWPHDSHTWFGIPYVALKVAGVKPTKSL